MKIYLAADFARREEMKGCRDVLQATGHEVVSRWLDVDFSIKGLGVGGLDMDEQGIARCGRYAADDVADLHSAEKVILFTTGELTRGGRHTELGMVLERNTPITIIGPREHVFQCLPQIAHYPTWSAFILDFAKGWNA